MKSQTTKKLFAFIISVIFFNLTQFAKAQVHPDLGGGGFCYCANIRAGCGGNPNCVVLCSKACHPKVIKIIRSTGFVDTSLPTIYPNGVSQSNMISFELPQPANMNSLKLFGSKTSIIKLHNNSTGQLIQQMEWGNVNATNSISN